MWFARKVLGHRNPFARQQSPTLWVTPMATRQGQLNSAAMVGRFLRLSIANGEQCAYCVVEELTASFAHDANLANKQSHKL